jgi:hypothetical protein
MYLGTDTGDESENFTWPGEVQGRAQLPEVTGFSAGPTGLTVSNRQEGNSTDIQRIQTEGLYWRCEGTGRRLDSLSQPCTPMVLHQSNAELPTFLHGGVTPFGTRCVENTPAGDCSRNKQRWPTQGTKETAMTHYGAS